jgi:fucose 4-O-acetylase-like acetyltransferase
VRKIRFQVVRLILCIVVSVIGCFASKLFPVRLPWALDAAFVAVGFMEIGFCAKIKRYLYEKIIQMHLLHWYILAGATIVLIFFNGYVNMRTGNYAIIPLFWFNAVISIVIILNFSRWIESNAGIKIRKVIVYFGKNSLVFLCLNQLSILIVKEVVKGLCLPFPIDSLLILVISMCILTVISSIINRSCLKILLGR